MNIADCQTTKPLSFYWSPGNLQKPLPGDVSLLLRESFFCGRDGRPKVNQQIIFFIFNNLQQPTLPIETNYNQLLPAINLYYNTPM